MSKFFKTNISLAVVVILAALPISRWFFIAPVGARFSNLGLTMTSLGQIAGLLGVTLFAVNLIISVRLKILDKIFYGLNNLYNLHHQIGAIAFCLLLFHPLFLVVRYALLSLQSAALFFVPFQDLAMTFGILGLIFMIVLMVLTLYIKLKYQIWKVSHKLMVAVFVLAILHVFLITSDVSRDGLLRFYILGLGILGLALSGYKAYFSKLWPQSIEYVIKSVAPLNDNMIEIELAPQAGNRVFKFMPGQFIFISFMSSGISREAHPFSISSAMREKNLKLVIKALGDFTGKLNNLKAGDRALVEGPFGRFSYKTIANKNQIWIAGGVGVTPFLSMARSLSEPDQRVDLYYCTRNIGEAVLIDELSALALANKNLRLISWFSDERGFITGNNIIEISQGLTDKDIFICGPVPFMDGLRKQLKELRVSGKNIHLEKFKLL